MKILFENIEGNVFKLKENLEHRTFQQIRDDEDLNGTNHDLRLTCVKCGKSETCRCSKPKRKFNGIRDECSEQK